MTTIDKLCYHSRLRYVNADVKFWYTVITLLLCALSRSMTVACIVLVVNGILTVSKGGIPFFRYRHYMTVPLVFLFFSTLAIMFNISRTPLDLFAIPLGDWYLTSSYHAFWYSLQLIMTALSCVSCLYFLSFNTPMTDILDTLRRLHCPRIMIELMLLIYRFIFVLMNVALEITTAQNSRLGNKDYRTSLHCFSSMVSVLLVRSLKQANALYDAMEARCYDGTIRVLSEHYPPRKQHILMIAVFDACLTLLILLIKLKGLLL